MNTNKSRRQNTLCDIDVVTREQAYAPIGGKLAEFNRHKKVLVDGLREEYQRGPKSEPFDADKAWHDLTFVAKMYFWDELARAQTIPPTERFKRLSQLARVLGRAHSLAEVVIRQDLGRDLLKAWFADSNMPLGSNAALSVVKEVEQAIANLAALETAAAKAAFANVNGSTGGRPPILPSDYIHGLAGVYRRNTGRGPGRGRGPFAKFVCKFVAATNDSDFEFDGDSVVGAIQEAHRRHNPSMLGD